VSLALIVLIAAATAVAAAVAVAVKATWRVAAPNEALIISGRHDRHERGDAGSRPEMPGFRIVTGRGAFIRPGIETVRRLSLELRETALAIDCVTHQGIPLGVRGLVVFKVGDDDASIARAARRFLDHQDQVVAWVHNVFAGHLRAIVGNLTVEELIRDRHSLTQLMLSASGAEMARLGLRVESFQIQEIDDPTGYIENLGRPRAAAAASQARIAEAVADREAAEQEQLARAQKAVARRDSEIKQARCQADVDEAAARAGLAGPLAEVAPARRPW
jgi:flotillin